MRFLPGTTRLLGSEARDGGGIPFAIGGCGRVVVVGCTSSIWAVSAATPEVVAPPVASG